MRLSSLICVSKHEAGRPLVSSRAPSDCIKAMILVFNQIFTSFVEDMTSYYDPCRYDKILVISLFLFLYFSDDLSLPAINPTPRTSKARADGFLLRFHEHRKKKSKVKQTKV
jgi:hypothetical protein